MCVCFFLPASADRCARPWLGGEGAGEGEPTSVHHSPAREVEVAVEQGGRERSQLGQEKEMTRRRQGDSEFQHSAFFLIMKYV